MLIFIFRKCDKKFSCTESRYPEINKKIEKFINKTRQFPDFQDVKSLVNEANAELHLGAAQLHNEAEQIFRSIGKRLKGRREIDDTNVILSYLPENDHEDPAANDEELNKVLVKQAKEGKERLEKYFDDFYEQHVLSKGSDSAEQTKISNYFAPNEQHEDKEEKNTENEEKPTDVVSNTGDSLDKDLVEGN